MRSSRTTAKRLAGPKAALVAPSVALKPLSSALTEPPNAAITSSAAKYITPFCTSMLIGLSPAGVRRTAVVGVWARRRSATMGRRRFMPAFGLSHREMQNAECRVQNWRRSLSAFCILHSAFVLVLAGCGGEKPNTPQVSKDPISVRGWLLDVEGSASPIRTAETEAARKAHLFQATYVEVVNAPYVSGGIAENGSFLLLDVPPGKVTIVFSAPGAQSAKLEIDNVPGNADIFLR